MGTTLTVVHLLLSMALIGLVLMQHGKGADAGAAFGSGASGTVFGARGSANFLSRTTAVLALLFFVTSLSLAWFSMQQSAPASLMDSVPAAPAQVEQKTELPSVVVEPAKQVTDVPEVKVEAQPAQADVPAVSQEQPKPAE